MSLRRIIAAVVVGAFGPAGLLVACGNSPDESTLPNLEFLQFGDPAESVYCLPYPVGEYVYINNTYSTRPSHVGRFAYDFAMPFGSEIAAARAAPSPNAVTTTATTTEPVVTRTVSSSFTMTARWRSIST